MLKAIILKKENINNYPESYKPILEKLLEEFESGNRVVAMEKITKSGVFINRYEYDKTKWKYILTDSFKV